jgi:hypothetical protein
MLAPRMYPSSFDGCGRIVDVRVMTGKWSQGRENSLLVLSQAR